MKTQNCWTYKEDCILWLNNSFSFIGPINGTRFTRVAELDQLMTASVAFNLF